MPLENACEIVVFPMRFEVAPPCPIVYAGYEPLLIGINWDSAGTRWVSATVQSFTDSFGNPVNTDPASVTFVRSQGNIVKRVEFLQLVSQDVFCKYEIVYAGSAPGDEFVFDPTILLKKGVGPASGRSSITGK